MVDTKTTITASNHIKLIQHNTARSTIPMHSCLETAVRNQIDCVLIQEPWVMQTDDSFSTVSHPAYYGLLPSGTSVRPRVAAFARKASRYVFTQRTDLGADSDMLVLDVSGSDIETFQIVNIYNEKSLDDLVDGYTVQRSLQHYTLQKQTLVLGDFNAHHSWWNSDISNPIRCDQLIPWLESNNMELVNEPDIKTFSRPNSTNSVKENPPPQHHNHKEF